MFHSDTLAETAYVTRSLPRVQVRPMKRLVKTLTAAVTALSLMVATAVPAHADRASDNLAKAVIAAIAIGAIVNSIDKGRAHPVPQPARPQEVRNRQVPQVCAIEINGARRDVVFYPERCLRREGFSYRLPRHCATDIRIQGHRDRAYSEQCLRDAGFRVSDRRHDRRRDRWHDRRDDRRDYRDDDFGHGRDFYDR